MQINWSISVPMCVYIYVHIKTNDWMISEDINSRHFSTPRVGSCAALCCHVHAGTDCPEQSPWEAWKKSQNASTMVSSMRKSKSPEVQSQVVICGTCVAITLTVCWSSGHGVPPFCNDLAWRSCKASVALLESSILGALLEVLLYFCFKEHMLLCQSTISLINHWLKNMFGSDGRSNTCFPRNCVLYLAWTSLDMWTVLGVPWEKIIRLLPFQNDVITLTYIKLLIQKIIYKG